MNKTSIEWTHRPETGGPVGGMTWNPIRARRKSTGKTGTFCTRISPGCKNCYASTINKRFGTGAEYTVPELADHEFFIDERILAEPLKRKKPATIFVGDMFDLFHEAIDVVFLGRVFGMMARCPQHTFQLLTKRAEYMQAILSRAVKYNDEHITTPLPNVWLGVSVEDQQRADERIPFLLETPAAVRFLSVEPLLEAVELLKIAPDLHDMQTGATIDWVIVGGESGPGARPFNLAWAESLLLQCRVAGTPFFMKQVGSNPWFVNDGMDWVRGKGGDPSEWPEHLRVREFPR
jgi:protein gp37